MCMPVRCWAFAALSRWMALWTEHEKSLRRRGRCGGCAVSERSASSAAAQLLHSLACVRRRRRCAAAVRRQACITVVWSRPPNCLPIAGSDSPVSSRARYMATCRGQATRGAARRSRAAPRARGRSARTTAAWISAIELRLAPPGAAGARIERVEDLVGELGGERPAGQRAEGDDADQRALERADVGLDALGDHAQSAARRRARRRRGGRACAGSPGAWRGRAAGCRRRGRPRSARAGGPRAPAGRAAGGRR